MNADIRLALAAALLCLPHVANSQVPGAAQADPETFCLRDRATRLSSNIDCEQARPKVIVVNQYQEPDTSITVDLPDIVVSDCQAAITLEYSQHGASARASGFIENESCPASSGSFVVSIRTRNELGEALTEDHHETWQRSDAAPVAFSKDYPIGENVDLVRIRTLKSTCKCATTAGGDTQE